MRKQKQATIEDPDPKLVAGVLEGNEAAHLTFFRKYMPFIRTCVRMCVFFDMDAEDMEDIESRVIEAVFQKLEKWDSAEGTFAGYAYGISKKVVLASWDDRKKELPAITVNELKPQGAQRIELENQPEADPPGPKMQALLDAFHLVCDELDEEETVVLQHILDHVVSKEPHAVLAERLNISEASAKMRVSRLKKKLEREIATRLAVKAA